MKTPWQTYLDTLPYKKTFLHRDEFVATYPDMKIDLPAILIKTENAVPVVVASVAEIRATKTLPDLISLVTEKLKITTNG
jgi:hypothetical protein